MDGGSCVWAATMCSNPGKSGLQGIDENRWAYGGCRGGVGWSTPGDWLKVQLSSYDGLGMSRAVYPASSFGQADLAGH